MSPKQAAFLLLDCLEAFYGGAAGGGKSDALLAAALQYVDVPGYAALILRRSFRQLDQPDAIMARSKEWLMPHRDTGGVHWNDDAKRWTFPSGATLTFGYLDHDDDVYNYQGPAFQFIGWDELTQFDEKPYDYLFSRSRRRKDLKSLGVPVRHRSASNPGGVGHAWVKARFIAPETRKPGVIFIPARMEDNPGLDVDEYRLSMSHLDPVLRAQLEEGDWGVFEGAAFTVTDDHLVDAFPLDNTVERFEAADYGLNGAPWALVAVDYEGNLIFADMVYERDLIPSQLCPLVLAQRKAGWGFDHYAYMDPSVWHRTGSINKWGAPAVLADEFGDNGVALVRANNDPRAGLIRLRELLKLDPAHPFPNWHPRAGEKGSPRMFLHAGNCKPLIDELKGAPLQPLDKRNGGEIVDPVWESRHGHAVAMARYAVMTRPDASDRPEDEPEDWRAYRQQQLLKQHEDAREEALKRKSLNNARYQLN